MFSAGCIFRKTFWDRHRIPFTTMGEILDNQILPFPLHFPAHKTLVCIKGKDLSCMNTELML